MAKAKVRSGWRNRIVGQGEKPASEFNANPLNFRKHPVNQRNALRGSLGELGWIQNVIVNRTTGNIVDGHARVEEALAKGGATLVPFVEVELSEGEEKLALSLLDPISALAETDKQQLDALLREVNTGDADLQSFLSEMAAKEQVTLKEYGLVSDDGEAGTQPSAPVEKYPLAIVVSRDIKNEWELFKADHGFSTDTQGFSFLWEQQVSQ